jgi:hypothetical protein
MCLGSGQQQGIVVQSIIGNALDSESVHDGYLPEMLIWDQANGRTWFGGQI